MKNSVYYIHTYIGSWCISQSNNYICETGLKISDHINSRTQGWQDIQGLKKTIDSCKHLIFILICRKESRNLFFVFFYLSGPEKRTCFHWLVYSPDTHNGRDRIVPSQDSATQSGSPPQGTGSQLPEQWVIVLHGLKS